MAKKFYIERTVGEHSSLLQALWEGDEQPNFSTTGSCYVFDDEAVAKRILWRLRVRYPSAIVELSLLTANVQYHLRTYDDDQASSVGPDQHLAMFMLDEVE